MSAQIAAAFDVRIGRQLLPGTLVVPHGARGLVIFAHGSGSSRLSPRNIYAARRLEEIGLATLLFDLLTDAESADRRNVFNIPLLASRVAEAIDWARADERVAHFPIGLFGASTGAGAALAAAASHSEGVNAIVSRGGRPDLAGEALPRVRAPTLLIVGGSDQDVLALNNSARARMRCETKLVVVPGAGHLFEEPGTLDHALAVSGAWFLKHLREADHEHAAVS